MAAIPSTVHEVCFRSASTLRSNPGESVDLVVTSPPYPMIEMWDNIFAAQSSAVAAASEAGDTRKAFAAMHDVLDDTWREIYRLLRPGGIACINVGDAARTVHDQFQLFPNHARIIESCIQLGFSSLPNIIWRKPTNAPNKFMGSGMLPPGAYVTLEHEYILLFRKGGKREFPRGESARRSESAIFWEERNRWFSDIWFDLTGTGQTLNDSASRARSGAFPFELAWRLVNMFSIKGDTVLDPFLGTGTTMLAAMVAERNGIGCEVDPTLRQVIIRKLESAPSVAQRVVAERVARHTAFMLEREAAGKSSGYTNEHHGWGCVSRQETGMLLRLVNTLAQRDGCNFTATYRDYAGKDQTELPLA